jgi:hypothetical protein
MITMLGSKRRCCDGITRRETLQAGALGILGGFSLTDLLRAEERPRQASRAGRAKSVIVLYLMGGAATQDMYDLKPLAPVEVRGEFRPMATSVPGIQVCEHLPRTARWMHKAAIVRSVFHRSVCHNPIPSFTGWEEPPLDPNIITTSDSYPPSMGSVCEYVKTGPSDMPAYVFMPCYMGWGQMIRRPGPYAGFLGKRYDALYTECNPHLATGSPPDRPGFQQPVLGVPRLPATVFPGNITIDRLDERRSLLNQLENGVRRAEAQSGPADFERTRQRAFSMLTSSRVRTAFDLEREDPRIRARYGNTLFGQSTLIARRLVEAGVRFINVTWDSYWERLRLSYECWDTHTANFANLRQYHLPHLDQTYGALLEDLDARGLLDETLVVIMSDFGRTPRVNARAGRDHWTLCYSVLLAGAGIRGGTVWGASDAHAAYIRDNPVRPRDICATIFRCLGIDPDMLIHDRSGRPVPVAHGGRPIQGILV